MIWKQFISQCKIILKFYDFHYFNILFSSQICPGLYDQLYKYASYLKGITTHPLNRNINLEVIWPFSLKHPVTNYDFS